MTSTTPAELTTPVVAADVLDDVARFQRVVSPARLTLPARLLAADLVAATAVVIAVQLTRESWSSALAVATPLLWAVMVAASDGYRVQPGTLRAEGLRRLTRAAVGFALALWGIAAVAPGHVAPGTASAARAGLALAVLVPAVSIALRRLLAAMAAASAPMRVVVAGDTRGVDVLLHELRRAASLGTATFEPVAVCLSGGTEDLPDSIGGLPFTHGLELVADTVAQHAPDAVLVAPCVDLDHQALSRLGARLKRTGTDLFVSSGLRDVADGRLQLSAAGGMRVLHVRPAPTNGPGRLLKDAVDRLAAVVLLLVLSPVIAGLILAIRLDSPGPALFRQVRVGRSGQQFTLWKLRTMSVGAELAIAELGAANECDAAGLLFKIRRDPRLTRVGSVLRSYSLDELPQLVNVLRGEMSLIGPRPALPAEVLVYTADLRRRLDVKPGMTGLWQVSGRSDLSWEETVRLDLAYVDNWSWRLDLGIAMRTAGAVLGKRGAY